MKSLSHPSWLDQEAYPFASHVWEFEGNQLHYLDEGTGTPVVMVHGTPSWSFLFRKAILALRSQHRVLALDHLGFGLSDKPKTADYSVQAQAERFARWMDSLSLGPVHLVVHDFGGPIGLAYALQNPERIRSLTISNTWMWSAVGEPSFEKTAKVLRSPLLPFLYRYVNFSARFLFPKGFAQRSRLTRSLHRHYQKPFARLGEREGPLGLALSLLRAQNWFGELWKKRTQLRAIPTLLLWGEQDAFLPLAYAARWESVFAECERIDVGDAGHFLWEEGYEQFGEQLHDFLAEA